MRHKPTFDKYGGHYHLRISTVEDLEYLLTLADGRWMATNCPRFGLNVDPAFLNFLDADGSGRIVSDDIREAVRWLIERLRPSDTWLAHLSSFPLYLINTDNPEGKTLEDAARRVLENLNLPEAEEISLEQVRNRQKIMAQADYNGDGVIPPEVVKDPEAAQFVRDLMSSLGSVTDAGGFMGINEVLLDQFKKEANAYIQWYDQGTETPIMPFGAATPGMFQVIAVIRDKVEQFFAQCALVRFDAQMSERIGPREDEITRLDYRDRQVILEYLRLAPLARPSADGILPLDEEINEFYRDPINNLREQVVVPMLGQEAEKLTEAQWRQILGKFAPYETWLKAKPSTVVEPLGVDKTRAYLNSPHDATIRDLIARDKAVAGEIQQLQNLEKLLLYHQWLLDFVNNYVSFPRLFDPEKRAIFEMGTLVLGGRNFTFSIKIENRSVHSSLAKNSYIYLLYLQTTGASPEDRFEIAVPVTRGSTKEFYVGRRGVFFTVTGRELDAQIIQIVENPISLLESIKDPFRSVYNMIGTRFAQITATIQKESEKVITGTPSDQQAVQAELRKMQQEPAVRPAGTEVPRSSSNIRDLMIGTGLLVAGFGTALKFIVDSARQLAQPQTLKVLSVMIGIFLLVTVLATAFSAWRKLRKRDLGVLLQASGWAINGQMRLIRPMARLLCTKARIPRGASRHHKELLVSLERLARKNRD